MTFDFKKWYADNKDIVNAKRRKRYKLNPQVRSAEKRRVTAWRNKKKLATTFPSMAPR
jgi:hypothetical protein